MRAAKSGLARRRPAATGPLSGPLPDAQSDGAKGLPARKIRGPREMPAASTTREALINVQFC